MEDRLRSDKLEVSLLDVDDFIKKNDLQEVTNPVTFDMNKNPTADGLLSNILFGITKESRATTFAYIDLKKKFLQPVIYKIWCKVDNKIKSVIHGIGTYSIDKNGAIVEDEKGDNGIDFLRKNLDKIKFRTTDSVKRDRYVQFLNANRKLFFTDKLVVIPPFYRDVKVDGGKISIGDINKLYINIIITVRSVQDSLDYGFNLSRAVEGRIQEGLLEIYKWFGTGTDTNPNGGLPGKFGVIRRANLSKTTDYATRLVLSAPKLNVEDMNQMRADFDHSVLPLASAAANFYPFVIFHMRRYFENIFIGVDAMDDHKTGEKLRLQENYQVQFSDIVLKEELDRFIHGYSDRLRPVMANTVKGIRPMYFRGYNGKSDIINRRLTWCDVIFQACEEAVKDKLILITRYPIDTYFNEFCTKIRLSSMRETEEITIDERHYEYYPKIRDEDIGKDTTTKFIDTMNICNGYLGIIVGDYDGDMVTVKGLYSTEANEEALNQLNSNAHYFNLGGETVIGSGNEALQVLYVLTLPMPETKLDENIEFE